MRVLILGGGITGLSAAWFLHKEHPTAQITLFEKTDRLGGWIRTEREGGFLFEKGPRTFPISRNPHLLQLIEELGLEVIHSDPSAAKRFILHKGKLRSLPSFLPMLIPSLLREPFIAPSKVKDESIYDFAARRFSSKIAETLFDPLTLGIYGGDIHKLSIRSCFPSLHEWEKEKGSVLLGLLSAPKQKKGLFTIKGGMEMLIQELVKRVPIEVHLNMSGEKISKREVFAGGKTWEADRVIEALPPPVPARSLWVVNLAYEGSVLQKKGFGYLVPTKEKESLLGVVFDSTIFPQQNVSNETRLTAMVRPEESHPLESTLSALDRHLGIRNRPLISSLFFAKNAIPQFEVGGEFFSGISVNDCVQRASSLVKNNN